MRHDDLVDRQFTARKRNQVWLTDIYSIDSRMKASLAVSALRNAVEQRDAVGTIVHSDRGDNAAMESFFALLQKNVLDRQRWSNREQLRLAIVTWIERTYHRKRRQRRLGKLTPIEFQTINQSAHAV